MNIKFYIDDYFILTSDYDIDAKEISPMLRRKLSHLDKLAFTSSNKLLDNSVDEIIFTSKIGELDRLKTIIEQYNEFGEVSPSQFSASVHNYFAGFLCMYKNLNIPYRAVASGDNSLSAGIVQAILSKKNRVLLVYADEVSLSCIISKQGGKYECQFCTEKEDNKNEFTSFAEFLASKNNIFKSSFGTILRAE